VFSKSCLGCNVVPPTLSPSVIKNLGTSFCKIDEDKLAELALLKKKKITVPVPGGKRTQKKKPALGDKNDAESKKDGKKRRN